ncbi:MAG: hypothetical protein R3Y47_12400 [Lachnospiraceae bacterium]
MYKLVIALWIMISGVATSYSVLVERKKKLSCLADLIHIIEEIEHEIIRWNMPIEEILLHMSRNKEDRFDVFFQAVLTEIGQKNSQSLHAIWSGQVYNIKDFILLTDDAKRNFQDLFLEPSLDSIEQGKRLERRHTLLQKTLEQLEGKYTQEQKLVLALGFFVSAFLSLVFI